MNKYPQKRISVALQKQLWNSISIEGSIIKAILKNPKRISRIKKIIKKHIKRYIIDHKCFFWINGQYAYGLICNHSKSDIRALTRFYNKVLYLYKKKMLLFDKPDTLIHAYVILKLYSSYKKKKYYVMVEAAKSYLKDEYRKNTLIRYRSPARKFYIDTIGMMNSFCYEYGVQFDDYEIKTIANIQLDYILSRCEFDKETLPYHVYDMASNLPSGPNTWGRGIGWFLVGLTEAAINDPNKYKIHYNRVIDYVFLYQNKDGYFYDDFIAKNHIDTSITSMAALSLAKGLQCKLVDKEDEETKKRQLVLSVRALIKSTDKKGQVMDSSGECSDVGKYSFDYGNYFAQGYTLALLNILPEIINDKDLCCGI